MAVEALPVVVAVAELGSFKLHSVAYQLWIASRSAVAVQLSGPQTVLTPAVPESMIGVSLLSAQKHDVDTVVIAGGEQAPCTSNSFPQSEAHAGRTEVKGTITPSGC